MSVLTMPPGVAAFTPPAPVPIAAPFPRPLKWTVAEFHTVRASGVWDGRRAYLIRGVVWEQGPMKPPHAALVKIVEKAITPAFSVGYCFRTQVPLVLGLDSDPFPDVAVVAGDDRDYLKVHPTSAFLVVEIADTSMFEDQTTKAGLYAEGNVPEYWIVDVNAGRLLVFRDPQPVAAGGAAYRTHLMLTAADSIAPLAASTASINVADLLP